MRIVAFMIGLCAPMPALALSCLAPAVDRSYAQFAAAEEAYVVVHGRLTLDMSDLPQGMTGDTRPPRMTKIAAELQGSSLNKTGFVVPFDRPVTLEVSCLSQWCGHVQTGEEILAFVRKDVDGYALHITPCGGSVFGSPKPEMLAQVKQCMADQACKGD
ncbi:MAG: hypothetical protein WA782_04380 [Sulfitobacter sp.]